MSAVCSRAAHFFLTVTRGRCIGALQGEMTSRPAQHLRFSMSVLGSGLKKIGKAAGTAGRDKSRPTKLRLRNAFFSCWVVSPTFMNAAQHLRARMKAMRACLPGIRKPARRTILQAKNSVDRRLVIVVASPSSTQTRTKASLIARRRSLKKDTAVSFEACRSCH